MCERSRASPLLPSPVSLIKGGFQPPFFVGCRVSRRWTVRARLRNDRVPIFPKHSGEAFRPPFFFARLPPFRQQVDDGIQWAREAGVTGVPTYIIDDRWAVVGAQDYSVFESLLKKLGKEPRTGA